MFRRHLCLFGVAASVRIRYFWEADTAVVVLGVALSVDAAAPASVERRICSQRRRVGAWPEW